MRDLYDPHPRRDALCGCGAQGARLTCLEPAHHTHTLSIAHTTRCCCMLLPAVARACVRRRRTRRPRRQHTACSRHQQQQPRARRARLARRGTTPPHPCQAQSAERPAAATASRAGALQLPVCAAARPGNDCHAWQLARTRMCPSTQQAALHVAAAARSVSHISSVRAPAVPHGGSRAGRAQPAGRATTPRRPCRAPRARRRAAAAAWRAGAPVLLCCWLAPGVLLLGL
jgi:hypothetical protein